MNVTEEMIIAYHLLYPHSKLLMIINFLHVIPNHINLNHLTLINTHLHRTIGDGYYNVNVI